MSRTLTVDLESNAFVDSIPQPATRRNWRAMILATDKEAKEGILRRIEALEISNVKITLNKADRNLLLLAQESMISLTSAYLWSAVVYQNVSPAHEVERLQIFISYKNVMIDEGLDNQLYDKITIGGLLSKTKESDDRALLLFCLVGALGYFDSRPLGITPFGYLSPQMLYVVCKLSGLKVQVLA